MASIERQLAQEFRADSLFLTEAGLAMHDETPDRLAGYLATARLINETPQVTSNGLEWVGKGCFGHVYGLPEDDSVVLKLVSPRTTRDIRGGCPPPPPNLVTETKFMDKVASYLAARDAGPKAPRQYGVIKFGWSSLSIQERVPSEYRTVKKLMSGKEKSEVDQYYRQAETAYDRLMKVMGKSALRHGIDDGRGQNGLVNNGNFFLPSAGYTGEEAFFAIDLLGYKKKKQLVAAGLTRLLAA